MGFLLVSLPLAGRGRGGGFSLRSCAGSLTTVIPQSELAVSGESIAEQAAGEGACDADAHTEQQVAHPPHRQVPGQVQAAQHQYHRQESPGQPVHAP